MPKLYLPQSGGKIQASKSPGTLNLIICHKEINVKIARCYFEIVGCRLGVLLFWGEGTSNLRE